MTSPVYHPGPGLVGSLVEYWVHSALETGLESFLSLLSLVRSWEGQWLHRSWRTAGSPVENLPPMVILRFQVAHGVAPGERK